MLPCVAWEFNEDRFILCEGDHDKYFLESLIKNRRLPKFQVKHAAEITKVECTKKPTGGTSGFGIAIESFPGTTGFHKLKGIAIVTDNDTEKAIGNIQRELRGYGYIPSGVKGIGRIQNIPVVIIPIPDNANYGNLEKLCLPVLYSKWPDAKKCVEAYIECTGAINWRKNNELSKAIVRSIISGFYEDDPNKGLGYLFQNGVLPLDHVCFNGIADTLSRFDEIVERGSF